MIDRVLANRALVLITFFLILVLSLVAASRLQIDPNNRVFFGEGHPHFRMLQDLEAQFSSSTSLVFLIRGEDDIFREPDLADAVTWLEERAWSIDRVTSVDSVVRHPYLIASDNDVIVVDTLSYVCTDGKCDIDKAAVMRRPTVTNRLANPELDSFSVIAKVDLQERDPEIEKRQRER